MKLITLEKEKLWEEIVRGFRSFDVYYLPGYAKSFQIHGDGTPVMFFYEDNNIKAINVVMKSDIGKEHLFSGTVLHDTYFDISTPYGYGGFIIEGHIVDQSIQSLEREYTAFCKKEGIVSEFVRFHPVLKNCEHISAIYNVSDLGRTITMELNTPGQIWNDLSNKNRNAIRKAIKSGVKIYWGRTPKLLDMFIPLYHETMRLDGAGDYYFFKKEFFDGLFLNLKYNLLLFYAFYNGKAIASAIIIFANKKMHYHLSATDREYRHLAPTNYLLYEVACWGCENGYKTFHLGGGLGSKEDGLFRFKKAFNEESTTYFSAGRKIFDVDRYNELVSIRNKTEGFNSRSNYFPGYRCK